MNKGSSYPEIRMPACVQAASTANHVWVSCSNTSARHSCFPSFFVRADGIITGRLREKQGWRPDIDGEHEAETLRWHYLLERPGNEGHLSQWNNSGRSAVTGSNSFVKAA